MYDWVKGKYHGFIGYLTGDFERLFLVNMAFYLHPILFVSNMRMNLIYVHVTMQKDKGSLMSQGQNLANEDKFSFCAPRPGLLLLLLLKAMKQYILDLNCVKLCCSNCILPFGTTKSVKSSKIFFFLFFKLLIFFPISKPFDFIPPPHRGGGMLNFIHPCR